MRTLDKLFLGNWLRSTIGAILTFVPLFLLVDIFGLLDDLIQHWPGILPFVQYVFLRLAYATFFLSPVAFLIGSFWMSHTLRRRQEWTVSLMSGRRPTQLLRAPLTVLVAFTALLTIMNVYFMPTIAQKVDRLSDYTFKGKQPKATVYENIHLRLIDGRTITIEQFKPSSSSLAETTISGRSNSRLLQRTDSPKAVYEPGTGWVLKSVTIRTFKNSNKVHVTSADRRVIPLVPPETLRKVLETDPLRTNRNPVQYSLSNLSQAIQFKSRRGMNAIPEKIYWHWNFGFPLMNIMLGMFGFVIGLRTKLGRSAGIGLGLITGFGYWIVFNLSISVGKSSFVKGGISTYLPVLYVYLPPVLFLTVCSYIWYNRIK